MGRGIRHQSPLPHLMVEKFTVRHRSPSEYCPYSLLYTETVDGYFEASDLLTSHPDISRFCSACSWRERRHLTLMRFSSHLSFIISANEHFPGQSSAHSSLIFFKKRSVDLALEAQFPLTLLSLVCLQNQAILQKQNPKWPGGGLASGRFLWERERICG